jgi:hypothetical protein
MVVATGCTDTKAPTGGTTPDRAVTVKDPSAHTEAWARLVWAAQKFRADVETKHKKSGTYDFGDDPKEVIDTVKFRSPTAVLTEYETDETSLRYCFTNRTGEFYATDVTDPTSKEPETVIVIGLGKCDYTTGAVYVGADGGVAGESVLNKIQTYYDGLLNGKVSEYGPVSESFDGTRNLIPRVAVYTARVLATQEQRLDRRPTTVTRKTLKKWKVPYPKGVSLGYYDYRGNFGYRLCVTDGDEEAIYEASPQRETVIRHSAGNCFAQ